MTNSQIAKAWATKSKESAASYRANYMTGGSGRRFYFQGDTIYSYGNHFPIARHYNGIVLFTTRTYSNTTAKHVSGVISAATSAGLALFRVHDPTRAPSESDVVDYADQIKRQVEVVNRSRSRKEWEIDWLRAKVEQANEFCRQFGFKTRFSVPEELIRELELKASLKSALGNSNPSAINKAAKELLAA